MSRFVTADIHKDLFTTFVRRNRGLQHVSNACHRRLYDVFNTYVCDMGLSTSLFYFNRNSRVDRSSRRSKIAPAEDAMPEHLSRRGVKRRGHPWWSSRWKRHPKRDVLTDVIDEISVATSRLLAPGLPSVSAAILDFVFAERGDICIEIVAPVGGLAARILSPAYVLNSRVATFPRHIRRGSAKKACPAIAITDWMYVIL